MALRYPLVRNLGVYKLTFDDHVKNISVKVYQLYGICNYTDVSTRKTLVNTLLLPHINYCAAVYHGIVSGLDLKLQRLVNKEIRYILSLP